MQRCDVGGLGSVCSNQETPPSPAGEEEGGRETEYDREMKAAMRALN